MCGDFNITSPEFFDTSPSRGRGLCPFLFTELCDCFTNNILQKWHCASLQAQKLAGPLSISWDVCSGNPATMLCKGPGHMKVSLLKVSIHCQMWVKTPLDDTSSSNGVIPSLGVFPVEALEVVEQKQTNPPAVHPNSSYKESMSMTMTALRPSILG